MITIKQNIQTCGFVTELTKSQAKNFEIIRNHWANFNRELAKIKLNQNDRNWTKYGITFKEKEKYFYLASVPTTEENSIVPDNFEYMVIPAGEYELFTHKGKMENIKNTLYEIYKVVLPGSNLKVENHTKSGFLHFEKYDYRFQWNIQTS